MTDDIMVVARDHLVVLLNEQKELLQALIREEGLLHSRMKDGKERVLSKERAEEIVELLEGEEDKVSRLEITLAVAGTVKAGKSTVVNAIIGTEALPNRARPMTALPTVIRHEPDRFEPALTINNANALNGLVDRIASKLKDEARLDVVRKEHNIDMEALIDDLAEVDGAVFDKRYEGRDRVFEALGRMNDLIRLGQHEAVGEALAIEEYDDLDEMPSLAVHFHCLADAARQSGSLALLDLPGFNEAQLSEHLTDVLEEQLEKASAILVVLDYTQLNTEASEELELLLDAVSSIMQDRMFVLVNKFDQRKSRDPDAADTRAHISADLMNGAVDPRSVFPVSAQLAYLAGRAQNALNRNGGLPSADDEPWVMDFVDFILQGDDTTLKDLEKIERVVDLRWQKSGFQPLLDDVVVTAQRRAGELAVQSTLEKLKQYAVDIEHHLKVSTNSLTTDLETLESTISRMKENMEAAEEARGDFGARIDSVISDIEVKIEKILSEANKRIATDIEDIFNSEINKIVEAKQKKGGREIVQTSDMEFNPYDWFLSVGRPSEVAHWSELVEEFRRNGKLEYDDKADSAEAWNKIKKVYSSVAGQIVVDASSSIKALMNQAHAELESELEAGLGNILEAARRALGDGGIDVNLRVPDFEPAAGSGKPSVSRFKRSTETRVVKVTVETHRTARFFGNMLGIKSWGTKEVDEVVYVIDRKKVIETIEQGATDTLGNYRQRAEAEIKDWKRHVDDSFSSVRKYLNRYHQSLIDGLDDRSMEMERREQFLAVARRMEGRAGENRENVRDLETASAHLLGVR
ncbi:MAG: dynamin family protein [bacterium]|nr:dynamin family protein [bacterium]